jgi:hypothetical protein
MIAHVSLDHLRAFTEGRLTARQQRRIAARLARCPRCRESVTWIRDVRRLAQEATAVAAPEGAWARIVERVEAGETTGHHARHRRTAVRAAVLMLAFAGAASAAVPGSPVRSWLDSVISAPEAMDSPEPETGPGPASYDDPDEAEPTVSLIVPLVDGAAEIVIDGAGARLRIRARTAEGEQMAVSARGQAASARFRSGPGRLTIFETTGGEIVLSLPHSARRVTLDVNGRRYLTQEGGQIHVLTPQADSLGADTVL